MIKWSEMNWSDAGNKLKINLTTEHNLNYDGWTFKMFHLLNYKSWNF